MATTVPLTEYFDGSEIGQMAPPELDLDFLEVVRQVTANKIISTVYLTGEGFEGNWAKDFAEKSLSSPQGLYWFQYFFTGSLLL